MRRPDVGEAGEAGDIGEKLGVMVNSGTGTGAGEMGGVDIVATSVEIVGLESGFEGMIPTVRWLGVG